MRSAKMFLLSIAITSITVIGISIQAQNRHYLDHTEIVEKDSVVRVHSNSPRPLDDAILEIREHEGWRVDYEDLIYSSEETLDDTDPSWSEAHPGRKVHIVKGGDFSTSYSKDNTDKSEFLALQTVVSDFNNAGVTQGRFKVVAEGDGRFVITPASGSPLDSVVDVQYENVDFASALASIARAVSKSGSITVVPGSLPQSRFVGGTFSDRGRPSSARSKLLLLLQQLKYGATWRLLYDVDTHKEYLNIFVAGTVENTDFGVRILHPLKP